MELSVNRGHRQGHTVLQWVECEIPKGLIRSPPQVASMLNLSFDWWPSLYFKWSGKTFRFAALLSDSLSILVPLQCPELAETRQRFSRGPPPCGPLPVFLWEPCLLFLCCRPSAGESHCPLVSSRAL